MWARCGVRGTAAAWQHTLPRGFSILPRGSSRREGTHGWRRGRVWAGVGVSVLLVGVHARHAPAKCLREGGLFLDPEEEELTEAAPLEMNEVAALTHTSLLRQASGVAVDGAIQLLHRTLRATLDFSHQHRKQLHEVIELLEHCTAMLCHPDEHDRLWDLLVAARARMDSLKQQLRDLDLLLAYACSAVEDTAMAAYISGGEFSASMARQVTDSAKLELRTDKRQTETLEVQYTITHTRYIEAAQKMMDDAAKRDDDAVEGSSVTIGSEGVEQRKESEEDGRSEESYVEDDDR